MVAGKYFTLNELSEYIGLGRDGINALVEKGYIKAFKDKSRRWLYDKEDIDSYFDKCKQEALI